MAQLNFTLLSFPPSFLSRLCVTLSPVVMGLHCNTICFVTSSHLSACPELYSLRVLLAWLLC